MNPTWKHVGNMKMTRKDHAIGVVKTKDIDKWC